MGRFGRQTGAFIAHVRTVNDHVNGPVLKQKLTALEAFGQFLANGLLDDVRSGKACPSVGLGGIDVPQQRQTGGDSTINRVSHDGNVGDRKSTRLNSSHVAISY